MTNQEQDREALIRHIADLEAIIRRRNEQIDNQAHNARETQQALEQIARERDEARRERDSWRAQVPLADWEKDLIQATETPRRLTPDAITDEMVERAAHCMAMREMPVTYSGAPTETADQFYDLAREVLHAALTEPPARPEGAEELDPIVDEFLTSYWRGDIDGADATDWLAKRGVRVTGGN